jgi:hypothetical protein
MEKNKALSIELDVNDIYLPLDFIKVNIGEVMTKYDFSIVEKSNEEKLLMVANELLEYDKILIGFACYNLHEVLYLNNELKKYNLNLNIVYIPSEERIDSRIQQAIDEQRKWGYRDGVTDEEIERNFANFSATLQEIRDGLKETSIEIKAV